MTAQLKQSLLIGAVGLAIGGAIGYFGGSTSLADSSPPPQDEREQASSYNFINPLLACGDDYFPRAQTGATINLDNTLTSFLDTEKSKGKIADGAIYFQQMNGGYIVSVNSNAMFTPGSMLKVPLIMSVYQKAETDPSLLQKQILYEGGDSGAVEHFTSTTIKPGSTYSVEDLIKATLEYSDNNAALLLTQLISQDELNKSYANLGIKIPDEGMDYTMSVRVYASFFRVLYNATYFDREPSEELLKYLSQAAFKSGIVAGVPSNVVVAHKFGERQITGDSSIQLHDCGIVYQGKQPYLLCVMLRGSDYDTLASEIAHISKTVYQFVSNSQ